LTSGIIQAQGKTYLTTPYCGRRSYFIVDD
jgi:hypothetical protein